MWEVGPPFSELGMAGQRSLSPLAGAAVRSFNVIFTSSNVNSGGVAEGSSPGQLLPSSIVRRRVLLVKQNVALLAL